MSSTESFTADADAAGTRVDVFLSRALGTTRSQIKTWIESGRVAVNNAKISKSGYVLQINDVIMVDRPEVRALELQPHDVGIKILFEDEYLAVLNKPAGISVHPSNTETSPTVVHGLLHKLKSLSSVGGVERPGIVHRIDKGTSGVLVVSKTDEAHHHLSLQFKRHSISRKYNAVVYGNLDKKLGGQGVKTIKTFFGRNPKDRKKMTGKLEDGRTAVTHIRVINTLANNQLTLIECELETGRTHQIRVHLTELGFPLVGDPLYGDNERLAKAHLSKDVELFRLAKNLTHQLLHATSLEFEHPVTAKRISFRADPPDDFSDFVKRASAK